MKKRHLRAIAIIPILLLLSACGQSYDYSQHLSEVKSDIFRVETEEFTLVLSCIMREHPYASDGVTCPTCKLMEITLEPKENVHDEYRVFVLGESDWGGEMSFRTVDDDWYFSAGTNDFPTFSVDLRVEWENSATEITATSVKNEDTMSVDDALGIAVAHEQEAIDRLTADGVFQGEFRVRLLRRDVNYYYVGIVAKDGHTISLLLGAESGKVLARRESD